MNVKEFLSKNKKIIIVLGIMWLLAIVVYAVYALANVPARCPEWCNPDLMDCSNYTKDLSCERYYGHALSPILRFTGLMTAALIFLISFWYSIARLKK